MADLTDAELKGLGFYAMNYPMFKELPTGTPVKKGDILKAQPMVDFDPVFGGAEIMIMAYNGRDTILGTSLRRSHPAYLIQATWDVEQLSSEIDIGAWKKEGSLEGTVLDYFKRINFPLDAQGNSEQSADVGSQP